MLHKIFITQEGFEAPEYLTARDYWAKTFEWVFNELTEPRTDCITTLPEIWNGSTTKVILDGSRKLTDLQREIIVTIAGAVHDVDTLQDDVAGRLEKWTEMQ